MRKITLNFLLVLTAFISNAQINADFTLTPSSGCATPHTVFFTDQSTQPDTWLWNFGDGSTSRAQNPIHTYISAGIYTVSLTITDTVIGGSSTKSIPMAVTVEVPTADFNGSSLFGCGPLTINFTNASTTAVSYLWNFGDGNTSTLENPTHTYQNRGSYSVSLTITTANGCTNTRTKTNYITVLGPTVSFGLSGSAPTQPPYTFSFSDLSTTSSPIISWNWNFGDGNTSTLQNPTHTYTLIDSFDVSLKVTDLDGCNRTLTRTNYAITKFLQANITQTTAISCNGDSNGVLTVTPNLGTPPYSYSWSNGAVTAVNSGLSAGTYTVTVTDASTNLVTSTFNLINPTPDNPNFHYSASAYCINETNPTPIITGTTGGVFKSTAGLSIDSTSGTIDLPNSTPGIYVVNYTTKSSCPESYNVSVQINPTPQVTLIGPNGACLGSTISLTANTNATGYLFDFMDSFSASIGSGTVSGTNSVINVNLPTIQGNFTYSVKVIDPSTNCFTIESISINVANSDDASFNFDAASYCNTESNPTPIITGTTGGTFHSPSGLNLNPTTGMVDLSTSMSGTYPIKYVTSGSCPDSSTVNITINSTKDSTLKVSKCDSYTWPQNGITYYNSGLFLDTTSTTLGCDSIVTLDLTINSVNSTISVDSNESCIGAYDGQLTAVANGGTAPYTYSWSNSAPTPTILGITSATYTVRITDANGCTSNSSAAIVVLDTIKPTVLTQNITVFLDVSGQATITSSDIDNGSNDACGAPTLGLRKSTFNCTEVGNNTIYLIATDVNGNIDSASAIVTVIDSVPPNVVTQNQTIYLDASGFASLAPTDIDNGSSDGCGSPTLSLSKSSFSCSDVGANTIQLIAMDINNNIDSSSAIVTVLDTIKPTIIVQNRTLYLDASGQATLTPTDIDNGSSDICGTVNLSLDSTSFDCSEIGINSVVLKGIDASGNTATSMSNVTVIDSIKPTVLTQNITVFLDVSGQATITSSDIDNGSNDACGAPTLGLRKSTFNCTEVGNNTIYLIATDVNGNIDSASAIVTVIDSVPPNVVTQNQTIYLDASGFASLAPTDIDNGSSDGCGSPTLSLSKSSFSCSDVGANTIQLIAMDINNNIDSSSAIVTVLDTIKPTIIVQNRTLYLDASGQATLTPTDIDNGSSDICGTVNLSLDSTSFDCSEIGINSVVLKGIDASGNESTKLATVTVYDTIHPMIMSCPTSIIQTADAGSCNAIVTWTTPAAADNCGIDSLIASHNPNSTFPIGTTTITYIAYDESLNTDTCTFTITITDNEKPVIGNLPADTVLNNDIGNCSAVFNWSAVTASDNCTLDSLVSSHTSGDAFPVGTTTVTYTAYDHALNTFSTSFTVTVIDIEQPTIVCPSNISQCDSFVTWNSPIGMDNCVGAITNRSDGVNLYSGDQFPKGITTISYQVTDASNNQSTCSFDVEVYTPPTANAGPDLSTRDIEPVQILANTTNADQIYWTPITGLSDPTTVQPLANPRQNTTYTLRVVSADGCEVSDDVEIRVELVTQLDATTLFTPNDDGRNDRWVVNKPELIAGCQLVIFNRNGTEVYSTNNYINDWDGTIEGQELPEGTYYYIISCEDSRQYKGPITLLRERR
ncbi:HYR domain-containing protein [bacterium]|nr:HYR domain-containing protein [bacterium]